MRQLAFVLIIGLLVSCKPLESGSSGESNNNSSNSIPGNGEIVGESFSTPCDEDNYRYRVVVGDSQMGVYANLYEAGTNCSGEPYWVAASIADAVYGDMSTVVDGAQNVDVTGVFFGFIPKTVGHVEWLQQNCPTLSWSLNVATNVAGTTCLAPTKSDGTSKTWPLMPSATKYTIMLKTETSFQLGASAIICFMEPCYGGQSAELRIRELGSRVYQRD
jgi:hypothetical protein